MRTGRANPTDSRRESCDSDRSAGIGDFEAPGLHSGWDSTRATEQFQRLAKMNNQAGFSAGWQDYWCS
jgi:hypothetical protein